MVKNQIYQDVYGKEIVAGSKLWWFIEDRENEASAGVGNASRYPDCKKLKDIS